VRPVRVLVVSEIPTPYRLPFFRRLAARPELDLTILFCAASQPDRPWELELEGVPHEVLSGVPLTFRTRRNTFVYEINPGILRRVRRREVDALVVGGYAVFAEQAAIALARAQRIPYLVHSESQFLTQRRSVVRAVKKGVLPLVIGGAAAGLAAGSAAARYLAHYGLDPARIRIVPNTIDVPEYAHLADEARRNAAEVRARLDVPERYHLFVGRLVEAKGLDDLLAARRLRPFPELVVAGTGPLEKRLRAEPGVRVLGFQPRERLIELYALAELTAVPSRFEPWGVVINEALACGSPVVASDAVGAAVDLVRDGRDGRVFAAGDTAALADALASAPARPDPRGGRIWGWTYDFAVEQFLEAVDIALGGPLPQG
jgi:glycosyltransferase involved in cell wall biosynthesis